MVRNGRPTRIPISSPQRSVQIALIFRLLLKITVDWPYNATYMCLEPVRGHTIKTETNNQNEIRAEHYFFQEIVIFIFSRPKPLWICLFQLCRNPLDLLANCARAELLKPAGRGGESYLLGLLAKIKCSICSYQLNLWYVAHGVT